jgi:peptidyl-prolyl cis-trans isomerase A (cyclophilin A)
MKKLVLPTLAALSLLSALPAWAQKVKLTTSMGDIVLALDAEKAPKTVANFVQYVKAGHYNGLIFHRVIDGFMVQAGGMLPSMQEKTAGLRKPVENEAKNGLRNLRGSIAMARTSDPHSATAQFFINVADNARLDHPSFDGWGYAVFGQVVEGMEVVDRIRAVPTGNKAGHQNVPQQPITITQATLIKD